MVAKKARLAHEVILIFELIPGGDVIMYVQCLQGNAQYFMQSISLQPIPYDSPRHFYQVNETEVNRLGIVIKKPSKFKSTTLAICAST